MTSGEARSTQRTRAPRVSPEPFSGVGVADASAQFQHQPRVHLHKRWDAVTE